MFFKKARPEKMVRFRRPEFQEKLARARRFQRKSEPAIQPFWARLLWKLGWRNIWIRFFIFGIFLSAAYFLLISRVFLVKEAFLESGSPFQDRLNAVFPRLSQQRVYLTPQTHMLIFNKARALAILQKEFPEVKRIDSFKRVFPDKVILSLVERESRYIWQGGADYFYLDQDGIPFEKIADYGRETRPEPLIVDESAGKVTLGQNLKIQSLLGFIEILRQAWTEQIHQTGISDFFLPSRAGADLKVKTLTPFMVYFDAGRDVRIQIKNLAYLLNSEIKPETLNGLSYIDLRLPSIGYYCYKDAPCALENATSTSL